MSASSKKKLRTAQQSEKMTEKQLTEQKEAKKLRVLTITFVVVLALMVVFALYVAISRTVKTSGMRERRTVAVQIGEHEVSNAELNYYFIDAVNQFASQYGAYASMFGLDMTKPLDEQVSNEESGATWADDFMDEAIETAKATYALVDEAEKNSYTLTDEETLYIDNTINSLKLYAQSRGYSSEKDYIRAMFGYGATVENFRNHLQMQALARSYRAHYADSLEYDDAALREEDAKDPLKYNSYTYNTYLLNVSSFLEGGTKDDKGNVTYSDEERAAAVKMAENVARNLTGEDITSLEDLDKAIANLPFNKDQERAGTTPYVDNLYSSINSQIVDWVSDAGRQEGDLTYIPNVSTSTDADGKETETVNGYYIVYYMGQNDNNFNLLNVRHILIPYEGGTQNENGYTTYTDEEKASAKAKAEAVLSKWETGEATEESFAQLATENSADPGSVANGGLYENVFPGQMVPTFDAWCFDESHVPGDTGIVATEYGYHIIYFSGESDVLYRDFMIENDLVAKASSDWFNALVDAVEAKKLDTRYVNTDMILNPGY